MSSASPKKNKIVPPTRSEGKKRVPLHTAQQEIEKEKKIAIPPQRGIASLCIRRQSLGTSSAPILLPMRATIGVSATESRKVNNAIQKIRAIPPYKSNKKNKKSHTGRHGNLLLAKPICSSFLFLSEPERSQASFAPWKGCGKRNRMPPERPSSSAPPKPPCRQEANGRMPARAPERRRSLHQPPA